MKTSFIRSFRRTMRRFERLNQVLTYTCCKGVTMAQCHVLLDIEESVETTIVQLVHNLRLDKSTLSRTVESLARLHLVERCAHPTDRRFTLLRLSPAGKNVCAEINREGDKAYLQTFKRIPRSRWDEIRNSIEVLVAAMVAGRQIQTDEKSCCPKDS